MKIILGIGNVGNGYKNTYHNIGFMVVDELAKRLKVKFEKEKCKSLIAEAEYLGESIILAKPTTFVNASGLAVRELMRKYRVKIKDVIVAVDDIDLPCGKTRYRESGSGGTHNGLRSIVRETNSQDFQRVKVGTGRDTSMDLADFIVSRIDPYKRESIEKAVQEACDKIFDILSKPNSNSDIGINL